MDKEYWGPHGFKKALTLFCNVNYKICENKMVCDIYEDYGDHECFMVVYKKIKVKKLDSIKNEWVDAEMVEPVLIDVGLVHTFDSSYIHNQVNSLYDMYMHIGFKTIKLDGPDNVSVDSLIQMIQEA